MNAINEKTWLNHQIQTIAQNVKFIHCSKGQLIFSDWFFDIFTWKGTPQYTHYMFTCNITYNKKSMAESCCVFINLSDLIYPIVTFV